MTVAKYRIALFAVSLASSLPAAAQDAFQPFAMDHRRAFHLDSPVDVSFLLDAPAGKHGFVQVKDGHFATGDGRRIRFWGVNITDWSSGSRQVPSKEDAPYIAATLARFGINSVRLQFLDLEAPRGLIAKRDNNTRSFDAGQLDREDFFIAEMEKRGIYIDFNLLVGRPFHEGDGVKDAELLREGAKGTSLFDSRLIALQREYAQQLLTHRNPYTGRAYTDDPAVAIVEINNENAIDVGYRAPSPFYAKELTTLYKEWLAAHRTPEELATLRHLAGVADGALLPLLGPRGEAARAAPARFYTEAAFFNDLQRNYFDEFKRYLKETLGSKSLIMATADHNHAGSGYPVLMATQGMDIVDGHTYWQHPEYYVKKLPMVNDPFNSTVVELSRSAVAGRPYTVSEVNHPFPNDYAGEGIPILAAYAALQDWDGIFWYTFEPKPDPAWKPYVGDPFDVSLDPVKMPELAAGALLFLRGDVASARSTMTRSYTEQQVYASMLLPAATERPYFTEGFPLSLPLEHEVRIGSFHGPSSATLPGVAAASPLVSDTGELRWYTSPERGGLVTVDTPRTQALIGFVRDQAKPVSHLSAEVTNHFCALQLTSMDNQPIEVSSRMLLVAGGAVENTGQIWNSAGTDLTSFGGPPTVVDLIRGTIALRGLKEAKAVRLQALDGAGEPLGKAVEGTRQGSDWRLALGTQTTTWYQITVAR